MHKIHLYLAMKIFQPFTCHYVTNINIYKHKCAMNNKFKQFYYEVMKIALRKFEFQHHIFSPV